ncbi:MAG: twin-arginine translocase subunit TatC [Rickettsiales bacterium]|jgi:sec-independent protein translocase protein TatC|nr:twin-arginine translocase subunit TatC [Rickettsiales bacterium]
MKKHEKLQAMPLGSHLAELRSRVLRALAAFALAAFVCYLFRHSLYDVMAAPLMRALGSGHMIYTRVTEAFVSEVSLVLSAAFFITKPYMVLQAWRFVSPGLYKGERRRALPYVVSAVALFFAGAAFCYFLVLPPALRFLVDFVPPAEVGMPLVAMPRISEYFDLSLSLMRSFGTCFMFPAGVVLLGRMGILSRDLMVRGRKWALLAAFAIGAMLTPPDVASQFMLAVPLYALYEVSLLFVGK